MLIARIALLVAVCSCHHLSCCGDVTPSSPPTKTQGKADSPPHPSNAGVDGTKNNNADNDAAMEMTNDIAADDDSAHRQQITMQTTMPRPRRWSTMQMTGKDAEDDNAATDVDAMMQTKR